MLQYLLNATTIWLICLVVYDLFLSRETYHAYNRVYLNLSLALGLVLPLWHWNNKSSVITNSVVIQSAEQASNIKQTIVNTVPAPATVLNIYSIVWFVYIIGMAIAVVFIGKELKQLIQYYRNGKRYKTSRFTVVETGKEHSPFSLFKTIYIRSRQEFNDEQWELLMTHEMQHGKLMHSIDKWFMLLLRVVLWFHPLVYIYYRRMMIVHEYQADAPYKEKASMYGSFLLEQSMLQQAPIITHSFNYSPIKNRISMLTRKNSSKIKMAKYLVVIPLTIALLVCCTNYSFSTDKEKKGNKIYFKGNVFETNEAQNALLMKAGGPDSKQAADSLTANPIDMSRGGIVFNTKNMKVAPDGTVKGNVHDIISINAYPVKMNGKDIMTESKVTSKPTFNSQIPLDDIIFATVKPELDKLEDADNYSIQLSNMIIDEKGKLVYYEVQGIAQAFHGMPSDDQIIKIDPKIKEAINTKLTALFDGDLAFTPAVMDGKAVICTINPFKWTEKIVVKNHVATLNKN